MKHKNKIIFLGSMNLGNKPDDGETMKNIILSEEIEKYAGKVTRIDLRNRPKRYYYLLKFLCILIFSHKRKVVLSASSLVAFKLLKVLLRFGYDPKDIIYWVIGGNLEERIKNREVDSRLYLDLKRMIVEGESMKKGLEQMGYSNVDHIPNFKRIPYIPDIAMRKSDKVIRFVFLSRILPEKGVEYIVQSAISLQKRYAGKFIVDFYGRIDPGYEKEFLNKISSQESIFYKGFLNMQEPAGYDTLASYNVMLFPTFWPGEGFPGIVVDAFIAGIPIVATDWNLNSSLIDNGNTGIIIPPHDVDSLTSTMESIINGEIDIQQMGLNAQKEAKKYDVVNQIDKKYLKTLGLI